MWPANRQTNHLPAAVTGLSHQFKSTSIEFSHPKIDLHWSVCLSRLVWFRIPLRQSGSLLPAGTNDGQGLFLFNGMKIYAAREVFVADLNQQI